MLSATLSTYLVRHFARWILAVFLIGAALIFVVDFFELVRRAGDRDTFTVGRALVMSLMRTPSLSERLLPFATLFGAIVAFVELARRSELVIIRSVGISIWQILLPPLALAVALGVLATAIYNPASSWLRQRSDELGVVLLGREQLLLLQTSKEIWLRQRGADGESVLHARQTRDQGQTLVAVTVFTFDGEGRFVERIEADDATLGTGYWMLDNATVYVANGEPQRQDRYMIATELRPEEVLQTVAQPDTVPFWSLPGLIERANRAGLSIEPYRLQFQSLLALPLFLAAMVLIAATVSMRSTRFGGTGRLVASGVAAGFVLYVATEIARDLGGVGLVSPTISAWSPGIVAALLGATVLLNSEDG